MTTSPDVKAKAEYAASNFATSSLLSEAWERAAKAEYRHGASLRDMGDAALIAMLASALTHYAPAYTSDRP